MTDAPLTLATQDLDAVDARAAATRIAEALRLAALPGHVIEVAHDFILEAVPGKGAVGAHTPNLAVHRVCPDTGASLHEMMVFAPVGPDPARVVFLVSHARGMRRFVVETPLDAGHHGRDLIPGIDDPRRWPDLSHGHLRLAHAHAAVVALANALDRDGPAPGLSPMGEAHDLAVALRRTRLAAIGDIAPERLHHVVGDPIRIEMPTPWTRAHAATQLYGMGGPRSGKAILSASGQEAVARLLPMVANITTDVVIDERGTRSDRIAFEPAVVVAMPGDDPVDVVDAMRDAVRLGIPEEDFRA